MAVYDEPDRLDRPADPAVASGMRPFQAGKPVADRSLQLHRQRVRFLTEEQYQSGMSTPVEARFAASGSTTPVNGKTVPITLKESHFH